MAVLCVFLAGLLPLAVRGQGAADAPAAPPSATHDLLFRRLETQFPSVKPAVMMRFYEENSPDILAEFHARCAADTEGAETYLRLMAEHFAKIYALRDTHPDDYERALHLERLESQARQLAKRIREARESGKGGRQDAGGISDALAEARQDLRAVLEKSFKFSQQNQLIEVNRLEAEVRDLRRLLEEREANRELILKQRYYQFTGETPPDAEGHLTADQPR